MNNLYVSLVFLEFSFPIGTYDLSNCSKFEAIKSLNFILLLLRFIILMMKRVFHVSHLYMMWGSFIKSNYAKIYVYSQFHFPHKWLYFFTKLFCLWSMIYDLTLTTWTRKLLFTYFVVCVCVFLFVEYYSLTMWIQRSLGLFCNICQVIFLKQEAYWPTQYSKNT